jgi:hypothetical protein
LHLQVRCHRNHGYISAGIDDAADINAGVAAPAVQNALRDDSDLSFSHGPKKWPSSSA